MLCAALFPLALLLAATSSGDGQAIRGSLFGKPFRPDVVKVKPLGPASASTNGVTHDRAQTFALTFQEGTDFIPDRSVEIWINLEPGTKIDGYKLAWQPTAFGTEAHSAQSYRKTNKPAQVPRGVTTVFVNDGRKRDSFNDRIAFRVALGKRKGNQIPGVVELKLANGTQLSGSFTAKVEAR